MNIVINKAVLILVFLIIQLLPAKSQEENIKVPYLENTPEIDGILDEELMSLQKRHFNYIWQFDNPRTDTVPLEYVIGYTSSHFYLYIETQADSINYRNRGFQNGDGFKLLFAIPQKDSVTDEFYELYFSPTKKNDYWARQKIWTYNIKTVLRNFSNSTLFDYKVQNGKCGFEARISWDDIPPYHPWMLEKIGFNLYFAKAIGDTITNGYAVVHDYGIWDEGVKRKFTRLSFENPKTIDETIILVKPKNRTIKPGKELVLEASTISDNPQEEILLVAIINDSSEVVCRREINISISEKLQKECFKLELDSLTHGEYNVRLTSSKDTFSNTAITLIPTLDFTLFYEGILKDSSHLGTGILNTLMFKLHQLQSDLNKIKPYEVRTELLSEMDIFLKEYGMFQNGIDPYAGIAEPYRRAFLSGFDNTYQAYTINLPDNYDPDKDYPLLVFLHGSGVDEQGLLNRPRSNGKFIELAPFARDMYNCYSSDSSQNDIIEAIEDVISFFSVDTSKIVIGGFSMGGYGALRTFYEHPDLYKGVAVFAGHPHLASSWLEGEHPNFLSNKYNMVFKDIPVFIYHGQKDGSLPPDLMVKMSQELINLGADVTLSIAENNGHEYPDKETNEKYFDWLDRVIEE